MSARSKPGPKDRRNEKDRADESVRQAIERAAHHAGLALAQGVASARALLDAASIGVTGESAQTHQHLSEFARALDQIGEALSGENSPLSNTALSALLEALDSEIARWEIRSQTDADARAVLRAFLGLREFLWELGLRPKAAESEPKAPAESGSQPETVRRRPRVQRIEIDG